MTTVGPSDTGMRAPLGAVLAAGRASFSVVSLVAEAVELCLIDGSGSETRCDLEPDEGGVWRAVVDAVASGQRYGYRVHGPYDPAAAKWCDPSKLLLDPYAHAIEGARFATDLAFRRYGDDTAALAPKSVLVDAEFEWGSDDRARPHHEWEDTVIYEVHVKGATVRHPLVDPSVRGTYAGLASDAFVSHLVELGVTAVELLPVHEYVDESFLAESGRTNYWGYNSIGYFAPASRYASEEALRVAGGQLNEFKSMVASLHAAGIEVLLDVVYNHTAESDASGPVLCFRGLDAAAYYRHDDANQLVDTTGCGNSINSGSPVALAMVLDSLRYWAEECHVDGFRFDLAPALARPEGRFDPLAPFLQLCAQDPVLRTVKLIAEPWDVGRDDSFALGQFPAPFREWNGRYRDAIRDFWRSEDGTLSEFATIFAGSSDLFSHPGRTPTASINFVTSHDGFTLRDLVTYDDKHNDANGQGNLDGTNDNRSWNCGVEGETDDPEVVALRSRQVRALLATLLLSCGVPMLLGGDELARTQGGNNNAYCQDNETSWLDWESVDEPRLEFTRRLLALRRDHRAFRRRRFLTGHTPDELGWFTPEGAAMDDAAWEDPATRCVAIHLDGDGGSTDPAGDPSCDDEFMVLVNGWWEPVTFTIADVGHYAFVEVLDTFDPSRSGAVRQRGAPVLVGPRSVLVLRASEVGATGQRA